MRSFVLFLAVLSTSIPACFAGPDKALLSAREAILLSSTTPQDALVNYTAASKKSIAAPVTAEYAYALAYAGLGKAALTDIDRALIDDPFNADVRFYLSEIFNAFGLEDASSELSAPVPAWLKAPLKLPALDLPPAEGDFDTAFASLSELLLQKRYAQASVSFDRLCKANPADPRCPAAYSIALQKLGAYKAAVVEAKKNMALSQTQEHKAVAATYIAYLEKQPPLKYSTIQPITLKGRYLLFLGGNLSRVDGQTVYSFNSRAGRFLSERLDISANAGLNGGNEDKDYNGLTLGAGARYNMPLSFAPLSLTLAAKAERVPAPEKKLTILLSPGISYFMRDSSLDFYIDIALSGPYSGSKTLSFGYTIYLGGGK